MRTFGACVLAICWCLSACDESSAKSDPQFIEYLATMERSIEEVSVCDALTSVPDFENRVSKALGGEVTTDEDTGESEFRLSASCTVTLSGESWPPSPSLVVSLTQESDVSTGVNTKRDRELFPGCWLSHETSPYGTSVRCTPSLRVSLGLYPHESVAPEDEPALMSQAEQADLLTDALVSLSKQG